MRCATALGAALVTAAACGPAARLASDGGGAGSPDAAPLVGDSAAASDACGPRLQLPAFEAVKVADSGQFGVFPAVAVAADGTPRLAFASGAGEAADIVVARPPADGGDAGSTAWLTASAPLSSHFPPIDAPAHVMAAAAGGARGVYVDDETVPGLHYFDWSGDPAQAPVDTALDVGMSAPPPFNGSALALDSNDHPAVAHVDTDYALRVSTFGTGGWSTEVAAVGLDLSASLAMAFDEDGQLWVAALELNDTPDRLPYLGSVMVWSHTAGVWSSDTFWGSETPKGARVVPPPSGGIALVYGAPLARAVAHAQHVWRTEDPLTDDAKTVLQAEDFDATYTSGGQFHIAFAGGTGVAYAVHDGCAWSTTIVDPDAGAGLALALDAAGRPHIAYTKQWNDADNGVHFDIWYATVKP